MGSNHAKLLFMPSVVMAAALILSGCQDSGQVAAKIAGGKDTGSPASAQQEKYTPEETSSFADVTKLVAYKEYLGSLFERLNQRAMAPWSSIVGVKKWLFVPVALNEMDAKVMSTHYMAGRGEVLAMQKVDSIWISNTLFNELNTVDQASLILNEILTSVYLLKNLTDAELCDLLREAHPGKVSCVFASADEADGTVQEKMNSRELIAGSTGKAVTRRPVLGLKKPLEQVDYHNIGIVKAFLQQAGSELTQQRLLTKMSENGFDTRIFKVKVAEVAAEVSSLEILESNGE